MFGATLLLLLRNAGTPPVIVTPYRDRDAYDAILLLLLATQEFDMVVFASTSDRDNIAANARRTVTVSPTRQPGFLQRSDGSPARKYREVGYTLTLKVLEESREDAYTVMDRLGAVVYNTLESVAFGGFTIGWLSSLRAGKLDDSRHPEYRLTITGKFSYVVERHVGFSTVA